VTYFITEVQMIAFGIIEIHGLLDKAQTQDCCVEIDRSLGICAHNANVVQPKNGCER